MASARWSGRGSRELPWISGIRTGCCSSWRCSSRFSWSPRCGRASAPSERIGAAAPRGWPITVSPGGARVPRGFGCLQERCALVIANKSQLRRGGDETRWRSLATLVAAAGMIAAADPARAEFRVRPAEIEGGEKAVELNGSYGFDRQAEKQGEQSYTAEIEAAVNDWWLTEFEGEAGRDPGPDNRTRFTAATWENLFELTEPGRYWADLGFFAEFSRALSHQSPDNLNLGPAVTKVWGRIVNTLNLFVAKDVGSHASGRPQLNLAWQTRLTLDPLIEPGIEIYSAPGALAHFSGLQQQDHRAGPVLYGTLRGFGASALNYEVGYLFG